MNERGRESDNNVSSADESKAVAASMGESSKYFCGQSTSAPCRLGLEFNGKGEGGTSVFTGVDKVLDKFEKNNKSFP